MSALSQATVALDDDADKGDATVCDFCRKGQQDSKECVTMMMSWLLGISVYNGIVPGVPLDLSLCCPCATKRLLARGVDPTATTAGDAAALFDAAGLPANRRQVSEFVRKVRQAQSIGVYRQTCQQIQADGRTAFSPAWQSLGRTLRYYPTTEQRCHEMERTNPEYAYFWFAETVNDFCPVMTPFFVKIHLVSKPTLGFSKEHTKFLSSLLTPDVKGQLEGMGSEITAGDFLRQLISDAQEAGQFPELFQPIADDGTINLDILQDKEGRPLTQQGSISDAELWTLVGSLQKPRDGGPTDQSGRRTKLADAGEIRRHLQAIRALDARFRAAGAPNLLQTLDPQGVLGVRSPEALLGLELVGYNRPNQAQKKDAGTTATTFIGGSVYGATTGFGIVSAASFMGGVFGAEVGMVVLPGIGAVAGSAAGAIIGAISGLTLSLVNYAMSSKTDGTLILQGWRVQVDPELLAKAANQPAYLTRLDSLHLHQSCSIGNTTVRTRPVTKRKVFKEAPASEQPDWSTLMELFSRTKHKYALDTYNVAELFPEGSNSSGAQSGERPEETPSPLASNRSFIEMVREMPGWVGDLPQECWTRAFHKRLYDFLLGSNGHGLLCYPLSVLLHLGMSGAKAVILDPLRSAYKWSSKKKPPSFWSGWSFRGQAPSAERLKQSLTKALEPLPARVGFFQVPEYTFKERIPIHAWLYQEGRQVYRGPRIGAVGSREVVEYFDVVISPKQRIHLRLRHGWLSLCRMARPILTRSLGWFESNVKRAKCAKLATALQQTPGNQDAIQSYLASLNEDEYEEAETPVDVAVDKLTKGAVGFSLEGPAAITEKDAER